LRSGTASSSAGNDDLTIDDFKADPEVPNTRPALRAMTSAGGVNVLIGAGDQSSACSARYSRETGAHFSRGGAHFLQSICNTLATAIERTAAEEESRPTCAIRHA
jgi:hypothetical protein